ncbi:MAG: rRNA pseudouridine synthase [Oscillospiraceae bacterium]|nr:rRNA pseudouridine synthase [Oscillospiraceae bacterium]
MEERIQKRIAESGLMSRRSAEEAIRAGRVQVNGQKAALGDTAGDEDSISLDGRPIPAKEEKQYYLLNKPKGYVCTMHDEKGRRSVRELLPASAGRVYPVGRLDIMSEGLLLMTNDGEFSYRMMHPSWEQEKVYRTAVRGENLMKSVARLKEPFQLDEARVQAVSVTVLKQDGETAVVDICIREGRNRQIRRMCELAGLTVTRLIRVREGRFTLEGLPSGKARKLTDKEISAILEVQRG